MRARFHQPPPPAPRRGAIVVLAAFCLVLTLGFLAFAVDLGYIVVTESELQNAADAGALSGARALPLGRTAAIAAAQSWAGKNFAAGQNVATLAEQDIEVGVWNSDAATFTPLPPGSSTQANAVRVTCRRADGRGNALRLFFAPVLGTESTNLSATATAVIERDVCGLFVGIQSVDVQNADIDSYDSRLGSYDSQVPQGHGDVCSDGSITLSPQGWVRGDARPGEGHAVNRPELVTGSKQPRRTTIDWTPVDLAGPSVDNDNGTVPSWALVNEGRRLVVEAGNILTLDPGTYYFPEGVRIAGTSQVILTGPTKFVLDGEVEFAGTGIVNPSLRPADLRIEMVSPTAYVSGTSDLHADIYAPTTTVYLQGNLNFYGAIFAGSIICEGSDARLHGDEALRATFDQYVSRSTLRE